MHNLGDDKELDRLSREAAGRYTPPGAPNWDALSSELDKVMPVEKKKRRIIFWWLLPVLLAGGATAYFLVSKSDTETIAQAPATPATPKETTTAIVPEKASGKETAPQEPASKEKASIQIPTEKTKTNAAQTNLSTANNNRPIKRFPVSKPLMHVENNAVSRSSETSNNAVSSNANNVTKNASELISKNGNSVVENDPSKEKNTARETELTKATDQPTKTENNTAAQENKTETALPETAPATEPVTNKKEATSLKPRGKGFSFGVLAGVDESTVKFKYGNNAGYNVGVSVGYHFNDKLSIHTAAVYTQKKYKVAGPDFTAPKGTMISYYKIEDVDGSCNMWEFPLVARYTLSQGKKSSVFASTGLSSYVMTNEDYYYRFYNGSGVLTSRNAEYYTGNTYFMSILHLSAGFESCMSKNLSLIVEPYAKLPLSGGIGFGSIRLSSFGLNFSVQYRQPAKK